MKSTLRIGTATPRIDGVAKVTGAAKYASDELLANPAFAYLVTSSIARGEIKNFALDRAKAVPGVIDILTYENVGHLAKRAPGPDGKPSTTSLESAKIWHAGQIIAMVVAETFEAAREAARKVTVTYVEEPPSGTFNMPGVVTESHATEEGPDPKKGDAAKAYASAPVQFSANYSTPPQHHNPIELFTTSCAWDGKQLTIFDPSQYMWGTKASAAQRLGIEPEDVRAISRYVGGAFGSKGPNPRTAWVAIAARRIGRPVKLVPTSGSGIYSRHVPRRDTAIDPTGSHRGGHLGLFVP